VQAVVGVRLLTPETLIQLPPLLDAASQSVVASVGTLDAELLVVLNATRIVPESVWQLIEKAEERS
jgi:chemotaxis signal transduction protein